MYFAGHLDYLRRTEQKQVAASMRPFLALPGSTMLPGAAREQRRLEKRRRAALREEAAEKRRRDDRDFLGFKKKKHLLKERTLEDQEERVEDLGKNLSEEEELRLRHLAKTLLFGEKESNPRIRRAGTFLG